MTREKAIELFSIQYLQVYCLHLPIKSIRFIIENKLIETYNSYNLAGTTWRLSK